jgi:acyl carrier protein
MSRLKKVLVESFGMTDQEFTDDQALLNLKDFDSMNHMVFVSKLEEEFAIVLTGDEIISMVKIGDIKKLLTSKSINSEQ